MRSNIDSKDFVKNRIGYIELNADNHLILKHFDRYNERVPFSFTEVSLSINSKPFTINKKVKLKGEEEKIYRVLSKKEGEDNVYTVENTITKEVLDYSSNDLVDDTLVLIPNRFCIIVRDDLYSFKKPENGSSTQTLFYHVKEDKRNTNNEIVLKVNSNEGSKNLVFPLKSVYLHSKFFRVIDIFDADTSNKLHSAVQEIQRLKREYKDNNMALIQKKIKLETQLEDVNKLLNPATRAFKELADNTLFSLTND